MQDHPRRCGENLICAHFVCVAAGSPPQVRGKPWALKKKLRCIRITPAGAGKTQAAYDETQYYKDHPRRCGENLIMPLYQIRLQRITPAGAGKTHTQGGGATPARDHPRRCGENPSGRLLPAGALGSPPQVRGKLGFSFPFFDNTRITPAGAGKTDSTIIPDTAAKDHPRRCGENTLLNRQSMHK